MARVTVELPSLLEVVTGGRRSYSVDADDLAGVLEELVAECPKLHGHLFDETGRFREHVLCFHNQTNARWLESLSVPVRDGDVVTILQAVSGG